MGSQGSSGLWKTLEYVCMPFRRDGVQVCSRRASSKESSARAKSSPVS